MEGRPPNRPTCKHGKDMGMCAECQKETAMIKGKVQPLVESYWSSKGRSDLNHLMYRAYRMGMEHDTDKEEEKVIDCPHAHLPCRMCQREVDGNCPVPAVRQARKEVGS